MNGGEQTWDERHYRNVADVLPSFDPVAGRLTVEEWIEKIEEYGDLYRWDDIAIRHYALSRLTGVARSWRDSLPRLDRTWQQWKELLRHDFPQRRRTVHRRLEAQQYRQKEGQGIVEYFYEKLARCNHALMTDIEAIEWIVDGIKNPRFRDYLGPLSRYSRPSELLPDLEEGSAHIREVSTAHSHVRRIQTPRRDNVVKCYVCKQTGHVARLCPNQNRTITCFKCNETGHISRACPRVTGGIGGSTAAGVSRGPTSARSDVNTITHVVQDTHRKYYKDAEINSHAVRSYVDLGSSAVTIRKDVADELKLSYYETSLDPFVGYGAGQVRPVGILTANVSIDAVEVRVTVHVVPNESQAIPLLVGHPFTEHEGVVILSRAGELKIASSIETVINDAPSIQEKTVLWSGEMQVIPNNYLGHITVTSQLQGQTVCVEGGLRETQLSVPRCVLSTDEDGRTILPVLNLTGRDITIREGDILARGETCEESEGCDGEVEQDAARELDESAVNPEEVKTDLVGEEATRLVSVINANRDVVASTLAQLGKTNRASMRIELTSEKPVVYRPYRLSYCERKQLSDLIDDLKQADVVEDSNSPFASPVILVRKTNGEIRMCIDYRALNKITVKDKYPLPRIDDQIDRLQGHSFYTTLDLFSGYYQIPVESQSRDKTAFVTPDGHFQFKRMPFGLANAPAVFQRLINTILGSLRYDIAIAYLDDIIIPSATVEEGLSRLQRVLMLLRETGLKINLAKCYFLKTKIEYLGYEISVGCVRPGRRKIDAVRSFPIPQNVRGVRSFVGLASYFRRFVKGFAVKIKPLTDLLKKEVKFNWDTEQMRAFEEMKTVLSNRPLLAMYKPGAETEVHTDASSVGLGGVLLQKQTDNAWRPICFYSRKTTTEESKYHSYELEALAIVCALEKFRVYLIGIHFVIKTDCNSLKMLADKRDLNPRIGRWFVRLSEFNYTIQYHSGTQNQLADALSRNPVGNSEETKIKGLPVLGISITTDWIAAMQRGDPEILRVRDLLEEGDADTHGKFTMYNARVYKTSGGKWRLYVPSDLRYEVVAEAHKSLAHLGVEKTLKKLAKEYYFPGMKEFVTNYVNRCVPCLYHKGPTGKKPGFLHPLDKGNKPFQSIHVDHLGPLLVTERGKKYVAAIVCGFSKYVVLKAVKDVSADATLQFMTEFMCHYGKPMRVITDRGTAFTAKAFEDFCREYDIQHIKIATGTPRANGQIERINRVILDCLATTTRKSTADDWDAVMHQVQWAINSSRHRVTQRTPFEIVFNYKVDGWTESPLTLEIRAINEQLGTKEEGRDVAELLRENQAVMKEQFDKHRKPAREYKVGDIVLIRSEVPATGESRKLAPKYRGPYEVVEVLDNDRYVIKDIEGEQQSSRPYTGVCAADRLKYVATSMDFANKTMTRSRAKSVCE